MKTRIKSTLTAPLTRDEIESLVNDITLTRINEIKAAAARDEAVAAIRGPYDLKIAACQEAIKIKTAEIQRWAESHLDDEFKARKSIKFPGGVIGFRTGMPKLKLIGRRTWDMVLEAVRHCAVLGISYIRTKEEVDREALIRDAVEDPAFADDTLKSVGLKLVQDETFYVEPNLTDVELRESSPTNPSTQPSTAAA